MKIQIRSKKEILNNAAALLALAFVLFAGWLLYMGAAAVLNWAFPSSVLEGAEAGLKAVLFAAVLYWLFIDSWLKVNLKRSK